MPPSTSERPKWLVPLLAFGVGLLVGWWAIGWGLWPVKYTNSLPIDLRATERDQYLVMVAESLAATGDLPTAEARLATWSREALAADLLRLQDRLAAENPQQAAQVQQLGGQLQAYTTPTAETLPGAATPAGETPLWRRLCIGGIWLVVAAVGVLGIAALWRRWRLAARTPGRRPVLGGRQPVAEEEPPPWSDGTSRSPGVRARQPDLVTGPARQATKWEAESSAVDLEAEDWALDDEAAAEEVVSVKPAASGGSGSARPAATEERWEMPVIPPIAQPLPDVRGMVRVGDFRATYRAGERGYDENFTILDTNGVQLGECGVSLADPIGQGRDQAIAFHLWVFDMKDSFTKLQVLMGEYTYKDTGRRAQLADRYPATVVRLGSEVGLETAQLALIGVVDKLEYTSQGPVSGVFAEFGLRLQAYKRP